MKRMALRSGRISSLPAPFLFGDLKIQLNRRSLMAPSQNLSIAALTPAAIPGLARKQRAPKHRRHDRRDNCGGSQ